MPGLPRTAGPARLYSARERITGHENGNPQGRIMKKLRGSLIFWIVVSMILGLIVGYIINRSLTENKFHAGTITHVSPLVQKAVDNYETKVFIQSKREVAENFSVLSD